MDPDDKQLVSDFLSGDEDAFSRLTKKYLKSVYNFLYHITADKSVIDDLSQETFIKAWRNIHKFDPSRNFKTWLFTIAKNTALDHFKKKKSIPFSFWENEDGKNKLEEVANENLLLEEMLDKELLAEELEKKLRELPDHHRLILVMRYREDFSLAEIASILGKPYNTIKSQHTRALLGLKKLITR